MVYIFYYVFLNYIVKKLHNAYNILHSYYIVSMHADFCQMAICKMFKFRAFKPIVS